MLGPRTSRRATTTAPVRPRATATGTGTRKSGCRRRRNRGDTRRNCSTSSTLMATSTWTSKAAAQSSASTAATTEKWSAEGRGARCVQELTRLAVHQRPESVAGRCSTSRAASPAREELAALGDKVAERDESGEREELALMTLFKRKIVHDAVAAVEWGAQRERRRRAKPAASSSWSTERSDELHRCSSGGPRGRGTDGRNVSRGTCRLPRPRDPLAPAPTPRPPSSATVWISPSATRNCSATAGVEWGPLAPRSRPNLE